MQADSFELAVQLLKWEIETAIRPAAVHVFTVSGPGQAVPRVQNTAAVSEQVAEVLPQLAAASGEGRGVRDLADGSRLFHARIAAPGTAGDVVFAVVLAAADARTKGRDTATLLKLAAPVLTAAGEREELQGELLEARRLVHDTKAERRARNAFISRMSHDLRSPLSVIIGFAQLFDLEDMTADQRRYLEQILAAGRRLNGLINQVLDYTSVESGRLTVQLQKTDVVETISGCVRSLAPQAARQDITVEIDAPAGGTLSVLADPVRLEQVFLNLLGNAIRFSPPGAKVHAVCRSTVHGFVRVEIRDQGPGIPASEQDRIFYPFERLAGTGKQQGTGLGLSITKALVEAMDGTVTVQSRPGHGSVFTVRVPSAA